MNEIAKSLILALRDLFTGRMLGLVFKPLIGAVLFWGVLCFFCWGYWLSLFQSLLNSGPINEWLGAAVTGFAAASIGVLLLAPLLVTVIFVTALVITSLFSVPLMVKYLAPRKYAELTLERGGSFSGGMVNASWTLLVYLLLVLLTLPLWFILPFGAFLIPLLLSAYLNARMFRYDALAEHASKAEFRELVRRDGGQMLLLGAALSLLMSMLSATFLLLPLVLLFGPVFSGLAFVHYSLLRLRALRQDQRALAAQS